MKEVRERVGLVREDEVLKYWPRVDVGENGNVSSRRQGFRNFTRRRFDAAMFRR